jgi:hypothetical protein
MMPRSSVRSACCAIAVLAAVALSAGPARAQLTAQYTDGDGVWSTISYGQTVYINPCLLMQTGNTGTDCAWPIQSGAFPMPQMSFSVSGVSSSKFIQWYFSSMWIDKGGYPNPFNWAVTLPGGVAFTPSFPPGGVGGSVEVSAYVPPSKCGGAQQNLYFSFYVWGANPAYSSNQNKTMIDNALVQNGAPPWYAAQILVMESNQTEWQFFNTGRPVWGKPDGIGVMQIEREYQGQDFTSQAPYWDFVQNIFDGLAIIGADESWASQFWESQLSQACSSANGTWSGSKCNAAIPAVSSSFVCTNGPGGVSEPFAYPASGGKISMVEGLAIQHYNGGIFIYWSAGSWGWFASHADPNYVPGVCNEVHY